MPEHIWKPELVEDLLKKECPRCGADLPEDRHGRTRPGFCEPCKAEKSKNYRRLWRWIETGETT